MFFTLFPSLAARRVFQLRGDDDDVFQGSLVLTQHAYDEGVGTGEFESRLDFFSRFFKAVDFVGKTHLRGADMYPMGM